MLSLTISIIFAVLGFIHVYWAFGGKTGWDAAIPQVNEDLAFKPSALMTLTVAIALIACAVLAALAGKLFTLPLSSNLITWPAYLLTLVLFLRSIGDFNLVGFFKRVKGSRFAKLDTLYYSPLCLALSIGVLIVVLGY